jgi:carbon-monoxide dehydrogenase small subunit
MAKTPGPIQDIEFTLNGKAVSRTVSSRTLLVHFLRDELGLRGPKIGCDTGHCGACTVNYDGKVIKSCMALAVQADGAEIDTVESLAGESGELDELQESFREHHALQCGYCTSGVLMSSKFLLERNPNPSAQEIREGIHGNLCRCTGYVNIVKAISAVAHGDSGLALLERLNREHSKEVGA